MTERLRYDDDAAFTLADDASTVARIVRTTTAEKLRAAKIGDWTALEVIGHVADMADVFVTRVRRCVTEERPLLESVDQDRIHAERRNNERDPMELSKRIQASHGELIRLLTPAEQRARPGVHAEAGELDAGHFGAYHARHAHEHVLELAPLFPPTR